MAKHLASYKTYVIRCWKEQSSQANASICRFTLEIPATGQRFGFTSTEQLLHTLAIVLDQIQTQAIADATEDSPDQTF